MLRNVVAELCDEAGQDPRTAALSLRSGDGNSLEVLFLRLLACRYMAMGGGSSPPLKDGSAKEPVDRIQKRLELGVPSFGKRSFHSKIRPKMD